MNETREWRMNDEGTGVTRLWSGLISFPSLVRLSLRSFPLSLRRGMSDEGAEDPRNEEGNGWKETTHGPSVTNHPSSSFPFLSSFNVHFRFLGLPLMPDVDRGSTAVRLTETRIFYFLSGVTTGHREPFPVIISGLSSISYPSHLLLYVSLIHATSLFHLVNRTE